MRYIVLGASAAGINGVRQLRGHCPEAEIILVSKDREIYSRCILHHYLGGIRDEKRLCFAEPDFETKYRVDWRKGTVCTALNPDGKQVSLSDGTVLSWDKLLIATGSHTFIPPVEGLREASGVFGFHNLEDARQLRDQGRKAKHIVVMGGGLTGLDAAVGFLHMGKTVDLVEMEEHLLAKQLDRKSAKTYEDALSKEGIRLHLGMGIKEAFKGEAGEIRSLLLTDKTRLDCDLLVVTAGVRANVEFLEQSGVECDRFGLVIDRYGRTNVPDVYGAGDVTGRSPIWPAAVKQGMIAADNMAGKSSTMDDFFASKSTMNFLGIPTMALGMPEKPDESYIQETEEQDGRYRKIIHKNGRIRGAILQGDLSYGGVLTQLIARRIDVSKVRKPLFEIDYSDFFHTSENFEFYYEET